MMGGYSKGIKSKMYFMNRPTKNKNPNRNDAAVIIGNISNLNIVFSDFCLLDLNKKAVIISSIGNKAIKKNIHTNSKLNELWLIPSTRAANSSSDASRSLACSIAAVLKKAIIPKIPDRKNILVVRMFFKISVLVIDLFHSLF